MRTRATADLDQLSDDRFFEEIAEGLCHVLKNATVNDEDARILADKDRFSGARILRAIAEEEASKFLILLDGVRCPRTTGGNLATHLRRFNDHLAKGIYAECCYWQPSTFGDLRKWIDDERKQYYLDGPNDVDWIFKNEIIQRREGFLYVDYVENDGKHSWVSPTRYDVLPTPFFYRTPPIVVQLIRALNDAGLATPQALAHIASKWRSIEITDDVPVSHLHDLNSETLKDIEDSGLLRKQPEDVYRMIVDRWPFPLHAFEFREIKVEKAKLREIQQRWSPDL